MVYISRWEDFETVSSIALELTTSQLKFVAKLSALDDVSSRPLSNCTKSRPQK